jgi:hypothetical protein
MKSYQLGDHSVVWVRTSSAGIFALILGFFSCSAHAGASIKVQATLPHTAGTITQGGELGLLVETAAVTGARVSQIANLRVADLQADPHPDVGQSLNSRFATV